jgi:hypothetical protein
MTALDIIQESGNESAAPSLRRGTEDERSREL